MTQPRLFLFALVALCSVSAVFAQPLLNPFTFHLGGGTAIDTGVTSMQAQHAAVRGRVVLSDEGHLEYADGTRCRLFGTSLQWSACFPTKETADVLAAKFRALGYNAVRFTYMDNIWFPQASIIGVGESTDALSEEGMQRLDYFVSVLEQNGIHPLFVMFGAWQPKPGDGIQDTLGWGARTPMMLDPRVQDIQRKLLRRFLEHVNPHTGLAYKDDPAIPFITVGEDLSFSAFWMYSKDIDLSNDGNRNVGLSQLARYDALWNDWLKKKYPSTEALRQAWRVVAQSGANLLQNPGFEDPFSSAWSLQTDVGAGVQALSQYSEVDKTEGQASMRVRINKLAPQLQTYQIILAQGTPDVRKGQYYRLRFSARTTPERGSRSMTIALMAASFPFDNSGLAVEPRLTASWQQFEYAFLAQPTDETKTGLLFLMGADSGDVFLDNVSLIATGHPGLVADEDLAVGNIRRAPYQSSPPAARMRDQMAFYEERLHSLFGGVRSMIRDTLKSDVLLCPSTRSFSFFDHHVARDYEVASTSDLAGTNDPLLTNQYGSNVGSVSQFRRTKRAFVLQQAGIAFPNPAQTEMASVWPTYACVQDWDGVINGLHSSQALIPTARIDSNALQLELETKPHILALMPWASSVMRQALVATPNRSIVIEVGKDVLESPRPRLQNPYNLSIGTDARMALVRPVSVAMELADIESFQPHREISFLVDNVDIRALDAENGQAFWNAQEGRLRVVTPRAIAVSGPLRGEIFSLDGVQIEQTGMVGHATVAMHSLDTTRIGLGGPMLLTIASRAMNQGATFNGNVLNAIGNGPLQMEGNAVRVTLPLLSDVESVRAYPLRIDGQPRGPFVSAVKRSNGRFALELNTAEQQSPWYRIEYISATSSVLDETPVEGARIAYLGETLVVQGTDVFEVTLTDLRGSVVARMNGEGRLEYNTSGLNIGVYAVIATTPGAIPTRAIIVVE